MTKTIKDILNNFRNYDNRGDFLTLDEGLKEIEAIISEQVIEHRHGSWCFIHCPYKSVEGVQITEEQTKKLLTALYGKESK